MANKFFLIFQLLKMNLENIMLTISETVKF